jgi:hypothetical protein
MLVFSGDGGDAIFNIPSPNSLHRSDELFRSEAGDSGGNNVDQRARTELDASHSPNVTAPHALMELLQRILAEWKLMESRAD